MSVKVGRPIAVGDVLSKSANLLMKTPALIIPQAIVLVLSLLEDLANSATFSLAYLGLIFVSAIVSIIVLGAYPSLVQEALEGKQPAIGEGLRKAFGKFWSLLIAGILVFLITFVGVIALIVPGIIFFTWYAYTVPAIMLENKGALDGMSASKAFGRDKKWSTFSLFVVVFIVALVVGVIEVAVSFGSGLGGKIVGSILEVPVEAWVSVILTYTYITYGPSATPAPPDASLYGIPPPAPPYSQPDIPVSQGATTNFCRNCGAPVQPGSKFCNSCGQPI
jgi:hypothetical protein